MGAPLAPGTPWSGEGGAAPWVLHARPGRRARRGSGDRPGRGASRGRISLPIFAARSGAPLHIRAGSRRGMCVCVCERERERERERESKREGEKEGDSKLSEINTEETVTHIHYIPQTRCDISQVMLQRRKHFPAALKVAEIG